VHVILISRLFVPSRLVLDVSMATLWSWGWKKSVGFGNEEDVPKIAGPRTRLWPNGKGGVGSAPIFNLR